MKVGFWNIILHIPKCSLFNFILFEEELGLGCNFTISGSAQQPGQIRYTRSRALILLAYEPDRR